jgi:RraA family protein
MALGLRVFSRIERPPRDLVTKFAEISTADLADVMHLSGVVDGHIRPIYQPMARFGGPAVTVAVPTGCFNVIKMAMEMTMAGDVLVIAAGGSMSSAVLGGNVCKGLKRRGLAGVIADGVVRDVEEIRSVQLPVCACGLAIKAGDKEGPGEVNVPVAFGNCIIYPGDIVVGDEEGIVAVPQAHTEELLQQIAELKKRHASVQSVLERGEVTNIVAIREGLKAAGFEFIESTWHR